jgi:hypothetical protein
MENIPARSKLEVLPSQKRAAPRHLNPRTHERFKGKIRLSTNLAGRNVQTVKPDWRHIKMDWLNTGPQII